MPPRSAWMRSILTGVCLCALVLGQVAVARAQDPPPASAEVDGTGSVLVLPETLGGTRLMVERIGPEEVATRMAESDDILFTALEAVLDDLGGGATDLHAAQAASDDGRYRLTALRIAGLDASVVLTALFTELLGEQLRASGVEDQATVDDMASRLEPILPWKVVVDREIVSPQEGPDTTFELVYPTGEVLYLVQARDGLAMSEVLAALPEQLAAAG